MRHMLRTTISPILALALFGLAAVPAAAAGPDRSDIGSFSVDFPAGVLCDFAVRWESTPVGINWCFRSNPMATRSFDRSAG
jgi:hypothetical protein